MGAVIWIIQRQKLVDQGLRLFFRQPVVSFHRSLTGHGGDLLIDQILADAARILVEAVQHLQKNVPLCQAEKIARNGPDGKLIPAEGLDLKADGLKIFHILI